MADADESAADVALSKAIAHALRHQPSRYGLTLAQDGSVEIEDLAAGLARVGDRHSAVTPDDVQRVAGLPGKQRFAIDGTRIRAHYGHSASQHVPKPLITPPGRLFHATSPRALAAVLAEGLRPMRRQYVHLGATEAIALEAGRRRDPEAVLLAIDVASALRAGVVFREGHGEITLADAVPAEHLSIRPATA